MAQPKDSSAEEQEVLAQLNKIVLLKIKTLIVNNLRKEDIPEFEKIVLKNDSNLLLAFTNKKIPHLAKKIYIEIDKINQKLNLPTKIYAS